jgi:predicted anti-sigma-YlaC factor YlaD
MRCLCLALVLLTSAGCVKQLAINSVADSLSGTGNGFGRDDDPELIRESLPVIIKVMEQVHDAAPKHEPLAVALARAATSFGAAFLADDADRIEERDVQAARPVRARARHMFLRGRGYGLDALELDVPGLRAAMLGNDREQRGALLAKAKKEAVPALYWTGAAWAEAITNGKDDMALVGQLPQAVELMQRALALDEAWDEGSIHEFFLSYDASQGNKKSAKQHFERAVELSHEKKLSPYVSYAETVCVDSQDKKEFVRLLNKVLAFDVDSDPDHRLVNILAQRRARWLLGRISDLFVE